MYKIESKKKKPKDYHTPKVSIINNGSNELESRNNRTRGYFKN